MVRLAVGGRPTVDGRLVAIGRGTSGCVRACGCGRRGWGDRRVHCRQYQANAAEPGLPGICLPRPAWRLWQRVFQGFHQVGFVAWASDGRPLRAAPVAAAMRLQPRPMELSLLALAPPRRGQHRTWKGRSSAQAGKETCWRPSQTRSDQTRPRLASCGPGTAAANANTSAQRPPPKPPSSTPCAPGIQRQVCPEWSFHRLLLQHPTALG